MLLGTGPVDEVLEAALESAFGEAGEDAPEDGPDDGPFVSLGGSAALSATAEVSSAAGSVTATTLVFDDAIDGALSTVDSTSAAAAVDSSADFASLVNFTFIAAFALASLSMRDIFGPPELLPLPPLTAPAASAPTTTAGDDPAD